MTHFYTLAIGACVLLALATAAVEALRWLRGPTATLQNMRERALSWWVLLAVGVPVLGSPAPGPVLLFGALTWLAVREFLDALDTPDGLTRHWLYLFVPLLFFGVDRGSELLVVAALGVATGILAGRRHRRKFIAVGVGLVTVGLGSLAWLMTWSGERGAALALLVVTVTQLSDAFQYVVGKRYGRTPLAASISPHKTVEGLVGGLALAVAVGSALAPIWQLSAALAAAASTVVAVLGCVSGLGLSAFKRRLGVKDWGQLLKGHGGVLDRVDSLLLAAPAVVLLQPWLS